MNFLAFGLVTGCLKVSDHILQISLDYCDLSCENVTNGYPFDGLNERLANG